MIEVHCLYINIMLRLPPLIDEIKKNQFTLASSQLDWIFLKGIIYINSNYIYYIYFGKQRLNMI